MTACKPPPGAITCTVMARWVGTAPRSTLHQLYVLKHLRDRFTWVGEIVHDTPSRHDGAGKTHRSRFWLSAAHCACVSNLATHRGTCAASSLKVRSGSNSPKECCDATHHDRRKLNSTTPSRNHALSPGLWCDVRDDIVIAPVYTALAAVAQKSSHGAAALAALAAQEIFDERQGAFTESQHIGVHSTIFIALS